MKVTQLSLAHFRGYEQIDLNFEPDVNVIAGVNGVGKSGVLQALAALFSRAIPEFTPSSAKAISFTDEDIHKDKPSLEVSAIFTVAGQTCDGVIQRVRGTDDKGDQWRRFWHTRQDGAPEKTSAEILAARTRTGDLEAGRAETDQMLRGLKDRPLQPVAIYFSPRRQLPGRPKTIPKPSPFEPKSAYQFALDDRDITLREFMHWFRWQETQARKNDARAKRVLKALREVVTRFVPEFTDLHIDEKPSLRFVVVKSGVELGLHQLSDGERGLLAIIFDITRRLVIANPSLDDPINDGVALVLIDEIELHLHPSWQRQVLRRFTETFKGCQFIVTSHSPQVVGEVERRCLQILLRGTEDKVVRWDPPRALGLDSNRVLEELMYVKSRNAEIEAELAKLFKVIDAEDFVTAKQLITAMQAKLGENDPELTRARSLMAFLEAAE